MTKQNIEVIIYSGGEILIQDITLEILSDFPYNPKLRVPTVNELEKITDAVSSSLDKIEDKDG